MEEQPRQKAAFQMKFRKELELGDCSGKHSNIPSAPSLLRTVLNMQHRLKSQVSPGPQHMLKGFPVSGSQLGGKSVAASKDSAGKGS